MVSRQSCWIVGCHYYNGISGIFEGQTILLSREPHNRHDQNAIVARTVSGLILGHLSRSDASMLAPILDASGPLSATVTEILPKPARIKIDVYVTKPPDPKPVTAENPQPAGCALLLILAIAIFLLFK